MFSKVQEPPVAHKVPMKEVPCVLQKGFSKYGITLEDDGESIWLYATSSKLSEIFCTAYISASGGLKDVESYVVHNATLGRVGLYYKGQFHVIFDFKSKKACARSGLGSGTAWGNISFAWDDSMEIGLE